MINIMLVAVSERTREIGLRKALGATNRSILLQFFLEGAFLTLMSGAVGMAGAGFLMYMMRGMGGGARFDHLRCRSCRQRWPSARWQLLESFPAFIRRAKPRC